MLRNELALLDLRYVTSSLNQLNPRVRNQGREFCRIRSSPMMLGGDSGSCPTGWDAIVMGRSVYPDRTSNYYSETSAEALAEPVSSDGRRIRHLWICGDVPTLRNH